VVKDSMSSPPCVLFQNAWEDGAACMLDSHVRGESRSLQSAYVRKSQELLVSEAFVVLSVLGSYMRTVNRLSCCFSDRGQARAGSKVEVPSSWR